MRTFKVFLLFLLFIYVCSTAVRVHQLMEIDSVSGNTAVLTSQDGYRWLRFASEHVEGGYSAGADRLAGFPENIMKPPALPLLSFMTAELAETAGITLEKAGGLLSVFLPGLFVFPLGILLYMFGFPAAGAGACLMGSLSFAYLSRTSAYQIDTDMLNLFFISLCSLAVYMASRGRELFWACAAGFTAYVFWRWYFHSGFTVVFFVMLMYGLRKSGFKTAVYAGTAYIFCASPFVFVNGFFGLFEFMYPASVKSYHAEVSELRYAGFVEVFSRISSVWWVGFAGLLVSLRMGRSVLWFGVFYVLGLMAFLKGVRFDMFLAPVCGAGVGVLFDLVFNKKPALAVSVVTALMLVVLLRPYLSVVPPSVADSRTVSIINMLNAVEKDAVVGALWDHGFMIEYMTGRAVFADGASQFKEGWRLFSESLFLSDSKKAWNTLKTAASGRPVYMLFTVDTDEKFRAIMKSAGREAFVAESAEYPGIMIKREDVAGGEQAVSFSDTLYFRLNVIGETDIPCFRKVDVSGSLGKLYRLTESCS